MGFPLIELVLNEVVSNFDYSFNSLDKELYNQLYNEVIKPLTSNKLYY